MKTKIIWTFPDGSWRKISHPNTNGEIITAIKAVDDGTWWIWHDSYYNFPWTRKKFGL
jgi:hypothetical protein